MHKPIARAVKVIDCSRASDMRQVDNATKTTVLIRSAIFCCKETRYSKPVKQASMVKPFSVAKLIGLLANSEKKLSSGE